MKNAPGVIVLFALCDSRRGSFAGLDNRTRKSLPDSQSLIRVSPVELSRPGPAPVENTHVRATAKKALPARVEPPVIKSTATEAERAAVPVEKK